MTAEQIVENIKAGRSYVTVVSACLPALEVIAGGLDPAIALRVQAMGHMVLPHAMAAELIGYVAPADVGTNPTNEESGEPDGEVRSERSEVGD